MFHHKWPLQCICAVLAEAWGTQGWQGGAESKEPEQVEKCGSWAFLWRTLEMPQTDPGPV